MRHFYDIVEAVPETIHYNKIQADIGDDLMKRLAKIEAAIKSNTEKIGSVESRKFQRMLK